MAESGRTFEELLRSYAWKYYKYQLSEGGTAQTEELEKAQIALLAHVAALEAERDKLRKDSERLDWLEKEKCDVNWYLGSEPFEVEVDVGSVNTQYPTLREAIDQAMNNG